MPKKVYLIGSLRNPEVTKLASDLRAEGLDVFDDWHAAGPTADDEWRRYEIDRGHDYKAALQGYAAQHVFEYDKHHLDTSDLGIMMLPTGKSGHLEIGYLIGQGKPAFILLDKDYDRWDVMYKFATSVHDTKESLLECLKQYT